jgi:hypothetical protein
VGSFLIILGDRISVDDERLERSERKLAALRLPGTEVEIASVILSSGILQRESPYTLCDPDLDSVVAIISGSRNATMRSFSSPSGSMNLSGLFPT